MRFKKIEYKVLFNKKNSFVSPSLAVAHPNLKKDFEINTEWISTCAGIFKRSLFDRYKFPEQFITYSNNEYIMFSYNLYKKQEGKMIYTSKAKYRDIQIIATYRSASEYRYIKIIKIHRSAKEYKYIVLQLYRKKKKGRSVRNS